MRFYPDYSDNQPLGRIGSVPIFSATIIAVLYVAGMLATVMLGTANGPLEAFAFSADDFYRHGRLWQALTCTFINQPDFFFLFGVFFFYRWAVEIEIFLGRKKFLLFYAFTMLIPAVVLGLWRLTGVDIAYWGMYDTIVAFFIAFATLYPGLEFFGWVPLKYVAFACFAIAALQYFPQHQWERLSVLLAESAVAFTFMRYIKVGFSSEIGSVLRKLIPFRRKTANRAPMYRRDEPSQVPSLPPSVDAILDKIAASGFGSLTASEREQLEKARDTLNQRNRTG